MSKIKELELKEDPLDDSWEGGYETCKGKAVIIIKDLEKEIETLKIHLKYAKEESQNPNNKESDD